jgi:hypothetical protein
MEIDERVPAAKFEAILPHRDERQRRLVLAAKARSPGHGGISLVARASGVSRVTITAGVGGLESGQDPMPGRRRRPGAGRKPLTETDPGLLDALDAPVDPVTRVDPMSRLRWTTKSTRNLAAARVLGALLGCSWSGTVAQRERGLGTVFGLTDLRSHGVGPRRELWPDPDARSLRPVRRRRPTPVPGRGPARTTR